MKDYADLLKRLDAEWRKQINKPPEIEEAACAIKSLLQLNRQLEFLLEECKCELKSRPPKYTGKFGNLVQRIKIGNTVEEGYGD